MMLIGLLLLALAGLGVVGGVFLLDGENNEYFGIGVEPLTVFLAGAASALLAALGLKLVRLGARRQIRQRKEHRRLAQLSKKLDKVDQERRTDEPEQQ